MYIPTAGSLVAIDLGTPHLASDARTTHKHHKPGIIPIKLTAKRAGPVTIRFHLNGAAMRLLARHHKLTLRIKFKFTIPHHAPIIKIRTVTFTQPPKPPTAKQIKARERRVCLRKHPQDTKTCDRL